MPRHWALRPALPKLPYNVVTDFTHVSLIGHTPNVLIMPATRALQDARRPSPTPG
jgi:hypothetical protein